MILLDRARSLLARIWIAGATAIFLLLVAQSLFGKYQGQAQQVWGWALPAIMPTLSLIVSTLGVEALQAKQLLEVRRQYAKIAAWLSVSYLGLILFTILVEPLTAFDSLELLKLSNLWLGPLQGLAVSAIGVLFFSGQPKKAMGS